MCAQDANWPPNGAEFGGRGQIGASIGIGMNFGNFSFCVEYGMVGDYNFAGNAPITGSISNNFLGNVQGEFGLSFTWGEE